jgi:hypothetical protein
VILLKGQGLSGYRLANQRERDKTQFLFNQLTKTGDKP